MKKLLTLTIAIVISISSSACLPARQVSSISFCDLQNTKYEIRNTNSALRPMAAQETGLVAIKDHNLVIVENFTEYKPTTIKKAIRALGKTKDLAAVLPITAVIKSGEVTKLVRVNYEDTVVFNSEYWVTGFKALLNIGNEEAKRSILNITKGIFQDDTPNNTTKMQRLFLIHLFPVLEELGGEIANDALDILCKNYTKMWFPAFKLFLKKLTEGRGIGAQEVLFSMLSLEIRKNTEMAIHEPSLTSKAILYYWEKISNYSTVSLLELCLAGIPEHITYYMYDHHGKMVAFTDEKFAPDTRSVNVDFLGTEIRKSLLYKSVEECMERVRTRYIKKRRHIAIELEDIRDERLKKFLLWLKDNGLEDIVIVGGGVRDAFLGEYLNDFDIGVLVDLTEEEQRMFTQIKAQANLRVYRHIRKRLRVLAEKLGIPEEDLLPPIGDKKTYWEGVEVQYVGPVSIFNRQLGKRVYLKRIVIDGGGKRIFNSTTGPGLLQVALDCNGMLYGHTGALEDAEDGIVEIEGDGNNFGITDVLRHLRLKHQFGLTIMPKDYDFIMYILKGYKNMDRRLYDIMEPVYEGLLLKVVRNAKESGSALAELDSLGILSILESKGLDFSYLYEEFNYNGLSNQSEIHEPVILGVGAGYKIFAAITEAA